MFQSSMEILVFIDSLPSELNTAVGNVCQSCNWIELDLIYYNIQMSGFTV